MKNKLWILFLTLFIGLPCLADGGIPLWIISAPTLFAFGVIGGVPITLLTFALSLIFVLFVALIETFVVRKYFLKNTSFRKMFLIMCKANFVSTLVGFLVVIAPILFNGDILNSHLEWVIIGPWGPFLLLMDIALLVTSYFVEYWAVKDDLIKDYEDIEIKRSIFWANVTTYFIPTALYAAGSFLILVSLIQQKLM